MNSEELELSLRTEFEEQLKKVFADTRQEVARLQEKVEAEFEKQKSQMSEVFRDFSARLDTEKGLDAGFSESVVEHMRLARDEGARITATAIAEAEEMQRVEAVEAAEAAVPKVGIGELRDAINDISSQNSQAAILKTLVQHAAQFTTRGAFFILKNEHFVGWRTFGSGQEESDDKAIREIFFPIASETVLSESVRSLTAVESSYGTYAGDSAYLDKLEFGQPDRMFAIPLVARGRGVAVLYADGGAKNGDVNVEALETLVRVAGLTVEVIASSQGGTASYSAPAQTSSLSSATSAQTRKSAEPETKAVEPETENYYQAYKTPAETNAAESYQPKVSSLDSATAADYNSSFAQTAKPSAETNYQTPVGNTAFQTDYQTDTAPQNFASDDYEVEVIQDEETPETQQFQSAYTEQEPQIVSEQPKAFDENYSWSPPSKNFATDTENKTESYQKTFEPAPQEDFSVTPTNDYQIENNQYDSGQSLNTSQTQFEENASFDSTPVDTRRFERLENPSYESADKFIPQTDDYSSVKNESSKSFNAGNEEANNFTKPAETVTQTAATSPVKSRFSDRNVDLPIEVTEDERRLHNDARRFARLLVSEIKLYNEQKVKEGREANDLYERLREAIDRSREMYDKRVQPPVAAKFDYFHYELVNTLAEGEATKLGGSYSGANV